VDRARLRRSKSVIIPNFMAICRTTAELWRFNGATVCNGSPYAIGPLDGSRRNLGMEVCLGHMVLDGDSAPSSPKGHSPPPPIFSPSVLAKRLVGSRCHLARRYVYCGQTIGWIKLPLGIEVVLGPGHIVLDGDPPPPHGKGQGSPPPLFGPLCSGTIAHLSSC